MSFQCTIFQSDSKSAQACTVTLIAQGKCRVCLSLRQDFHSIYQEFLDQSRIMDRYCLEKRRSCAEDVPVEKAKK